jgi:hypothetical protein
VTALGGAQAVLLSHSSGAEHTPSGTIAICPRVVPGQRFEDRRKWVSTRTAAARLGRQ